MTFTHMENSCMCVQELSSVWILSVESPNH